MIQGAYTLLSLETKDYSATQNSPSNIAASNVFDEL